MTCDCEYGTIGHIFYPEDYCAEGDGVTDDSGAFACALAEMAAGDVLMLGAKTYYLASTLTISKRIAVVGCDTPWFQSPHSILLFAGGVVGIDDTAGLRIRDVYIKAASSSGTTNHGIKCRSALQVESCHIEGFGGSGVDIDTTGPGFNCNHWEVRSSLITGCAKHGIYTKGADANAGIATHVRATANGDYGYWEESFLGNTYFACFAKDNSNGAFKVPTAADTNRSKFIGCYSGDAGQSQLRTPSLSLPIRGDWVGGGMAFGCEVGGDETPASFTHANTDTSGNPIAFRIGGAVDEIFGWSAGSNDTAAGGPRIFRLEYPLAGPASDWFAFRYNHDPEEEVEGNIALALSGDGSYDDSGEKSGTAQAWAPNGLYFGAGQTKLDQQDRVNNGVTRRCVTVRDSGSSPATHAICWAGSEPTSGSGTADSWAAGDVVLNDDFPPSTPRPMGWMCISPGAPGTWLPMPVL